MSPREMYKMERQMKLRWLVVIVVVLMTLVILALTTESEGFQVALCILSVILGIASAIGFAFMSLDEPIGRIERVQPRNHFHKAVLLKCQMEAEQKDWETNRDKDLEEYLRKMRSEL